MSTHVIVSFLELPPTVNNQISSPETILRRSLASVRKRNQIHAHHRSGGQSQPFRRHRIFDENDLRSSTHTVVYDSSKSINPHSIGHSLRRTVVPVEENQTSMSSLTGSGNESDYDNNQGQQDYSNLSRYFASTRSNSVPVKTFHTNEEFPSLDAHLLGDQNETVLNNNNDDDDEDEHTEARVDLSDDDNDDVDDVDADENTIQSTINNNQQSDNLIISSTNSPQSSVNHRTNNRMLIKPTAPAATSLDDSAPSTYIPYRKDPLTTRKLLDIRSHLLLNTTLDAT